MRDPRWLSRFGNATRQAATYRKGASCSPGTPRTCTSAGEGLNVGFQDATNLGWKLAATVRGTAPDGLLDTYHAERHPVGAQLLLSTRAQTALMTAYSVEGQALRALLSQLIADVPEFSAALAGQLSALAVAYPPADPAAAHPLDGTRAPDLALADGTSLFALLRTGRHVLLDLTGDDLVSDELTGGGRNVLDGYDVNAYGGAAGVVRHSAGRPARSRWAGAHRPHPPGRARRSGERRRGRCGAAPGGGPLHHVVGRVREPVVREPTPEGGQLRAVRIEGVRDFDGGIQGGFLEISDRGETSREVQIPVP
ncbi:FAD-dependent monooxygenase [Streptomyces sp. M19]